MALGIGNLDFNIYLSGMNNPYLSYGVFGLIIIFCGFFELILPETRCTSLCDTMDQQEQKENSIAHST
ncbi:hypothetical protein ACOSQ3_033303 [Xanthoceras sorbifolium]